MPGPILSPKVRAWNAANCQLHLPDPPAFKTKTSQCPFLPEVPVFTPICANVMGRMRQRGK